MDFSENLFLAQHNFIWDQEQELALFDFNVMHEVHTDASSVGLSVEQIRMYVLARDSV